MQAAFPSSPSKPHSTRRSLDPDHIHEIFSALEPVSIRRMFGGKGVYHGGRIVAVELSGELMLKADDITAPAFAAAGAKRWTYQHPGKRPVLMPYWSIPEDAYDDPEAMARWVRLAYEAALRAPDNPSRRAGRRGGATRTHERAAR